MKLKSLKYGAVFNSTRFELCITSIDYNFIHASVCVRYNY